MAADTYSLAVTGLRADSPFSAKPITVGDSAAIGLSSGNDRYGAAALTMRNNGQVLCKLRDGSQAWYMIDAERSTPSNLVLKAV